MATQLDHRGWTAAWYFAPCVLCHQPAILLSPRGRPYHWTCALGWTGYATGDTLSDRSTARYLIAAPAAESAGGCAHHCPGRCGRPGQVRVVAVVS